MLPAARNWRFMCVNRVLLETPANMRSEVVSKKVSALGKYSNSSSITIEMVKDTLVARSSGEMSVARSSN